MNGRFYRALIVDDEPIARRMLRFAFEKEGIMCEFAEDGNQALAKVDSTCFDIVVTDLKMPNTHGHRLAMELLKRENRPVVAVHTGVTDVRITKDLLHHGVDDIVYKPVDYANFVAKMRNIIERQSAYPSSCDPRPQHANVSIKNDKQSKPPSRLPTVNSAEEKLKRILVALPLSPLASSIHKLVHDEESEDQQIGNLVRMDPSILSLVLRRDTGDGVDLNDPSASGTTKVVSQIGRRQLGELARGAWASSVLLDHDPHGDEISLARRRSLAAGIAAKVFFTGERRDSTAGISMAAVLFLLGRVGLQLAFPGEYNALRNWTLADPTRSFAEAEKEVFGASPSEILCRVLKAWRVPGEVLTPLSFAHLTYPEMASLNVLIRNIAELSKLCVSAGWIVCGDWQPGDLVDLPSNDVLHRHRIESLAENLNAIRGEMEILRANDSAPNIPAAIAPAEYVRVNEEGFDLLAQILPYTNVKLVESGSMPCGITIINALDAPSPEGCVQSSRESTVVICQKRYAKNWADRGEVVSIPTTVGNLKSKIHQTLQF
ncbi:response regulator [Blastopirellula marina]|uniref:Response regulator n=1 Tax=Blastopirellula marina TaxID=124 RepID=A0A2S8G2Z6_9BACT|nr:response regulator [Blastopirellula marina]PQO38514.1 hypothetical protein C5Y98_10710 [Blastopirellula marina]PTL45171.1 response regulator [Blastopirellula marina]